jgi:hypothetical protein
MGLLGKTLRVLLDVVEIPVAVVKDVATLGGELTDKGETYTGAKVDEIADDYDDWKDELTQ